MRKAKLKQHQAADREIVHAGIRQLLAGRPGRRFLWTLFRWTDPLSNAFRADSPDLTTFVLGQQNVGQQLLALLTEVDEDAWFKLYAEQRVIDKELKDLDDSAVWEELKEDPSDV